MKICRAIQNFFKTGEDHEYLRKCYCCRRDCITIKTLSSGDMVLRFQDSREGINIRRTRHIIKFFHVLLTLHLSIILVINQLNAQILVFKLSPCSKCNLFLFG